MSEFPIHIAGTPALLPFRTIATFPVGTFLENIAVRSNGSLLVSDMIGGEIHYLDPNAPDPQATIKKIHAFLPETTNIAADEPVGDYGSGMSGEAIVEDTRTTDVFYTFSGQHGKKGTWAVHRLDMRHFDEKSTANVQEIAQVPQAVWMNGATFIPGTPKLVIAESNLGQLICCDVDTGVVSIWLEDALLAKITDRPPWPAANGVQYFREHIYVTNSDRALLLSAKVEKDDGDYVKGSLKVLATDLCGDDLAFDAEGDAYIATNPQNTLLKFPAVGLGEQESGRLIIAGTQTQPEAAGITAVAFGRSVNDSKALYAVTTGGHIVPLGDGPGLARVLRLDVGVKGEA